MNAEQNENNKPEMDALEEILHQSLRIIQGAKAADCKLDGEQKGGTDDLPVAGLRHPKAARAHEVRALD